MKVLCTKPFFASDIEYINLRLDSGVEILFPKSFDQQDIVESAKDADVLLGGLITEELLQTAKKLKFIQVPWTGVDKLDFALLNRYNTTVCNSHSNSTVVAEHAVALFFDAAKKLSYHDRQMRQGDWNRPTPQKDNEILPFSSKITNSKVGIIGFGSIGKDIYKMLKGFNCSFKAFNRTGICPDDKYSNISFLSSNTFSQNLNDLDVVFISVALTDNTNQMVNESFLGAMSTNSILVNISRGEVVNEKALYKALSKKQIAAAAIDTWFKYPTKDNPKPFPSNTFSFHELNNLVMSPHRAGMIQGGFPHLDDAIENLNRFNSGKELINKVSLKDKY